MSGLMDSGGQQEQAVSRTLRFARMLDGATHHATPIAQWAGDQALALHEAYQVQAHGIALRVARGERVVGLKLAFTNRKTMARVGVSAPVFGILCDGMQIADGGEIRFPGLIRPRAEPEVVFRMARGVRPDADAAEALAAVDAVAAAIEIVDSRYLDFKFALPDVVADNASGCAFVLGPWQSPVPELGNLAVEVELDGVVVAQGNTAAILDHPVQALLAAIRLAHAAGQPLQAGAIVLAGSATDPVVLHAGAHMHARIAGLGEVGFSVGPR